jgi:single-strand DNA-binding protein
MNHLNSVLIEGNACRDAEIKTTASGALIGKMSIAVNRYYKSGDGFEKEVSFFDVDTFGKIAELCAEKCRKGVALRIVGRLKQSRWIGKDGTNRSQVIIIAEHVEFRQKTQGKEDQPSAPPDEDIPF